MSNGLFMQIIKDTQFSRRYFLWNIGKLIPAAIGFVLLWLDQGQFGYRFWLGIVSFVFDILLWAWQDRLLMRSYRCPRCGKLLSKSAMAHPGEGDPIHFQCHECGVEWDTGLRR